ncbi:MAG: rhomboid family intramembrane serine protease [Actinomycetota bacterium]|nr:rhomboid family intramembrane serine protease [Actinomycetota bacterium]
MTAQSEPAPTTGLARCYRHPMRETGVRCIRCNRPICPECMRPASVGFHCPDDVVLANKTVRLPRTVAGAPLRPQAQAYATWTLVATNVVVYLLCVAGAHSSINNPSPSGLFQNWILEPYLVAHGSDSRGNELYRLVTAAFLHINLTHLLLNMLALAVVGPFLERTLGWWRFLVVYALAALGGSLGEYVFGDHFVAVAGASGAVYGLFAAALLLGRRLNLDVRTLAITVAFNFVLTFTIPGISILGHLGGFVVGGLAASCLIGWPQRSQRLDARVQVGALSALTAVLVLVVVIRTVTFPLTAV